MLCTRPNRPHVHPTRMRVHPRPARIVPIGEATIRRSAGDQAGRVTDVPDRGPDGQHRFAVRIAAIS